MNFYYVFYLILISMISFLCFCDGGVGGGVLSISLVVDQRLILSTDKYVIFYEYELRPSMAAGPLVL